MATRWSRILVAAALAAAAACGGASSKSGTGVLALQLVDAPNPDVKGIVVTIDTVTAHSDQAGWVTVFQGPRTIDLLTLKTAVMDLGAVKLPAGQVTQVRLELAAAGPQYVVLADGSHADLKVPSGTESGVKLVGPFQVSACAKHTLTLDFDGQNSIEYHATGGPSPEWILRPVIKVKAEADEDVSCTADGGVDSMPDAGGPSSGPGPSADAGTPGPVGLDGGIVDPSDPSIPH